MTTKVPLDIETLRCGLDPQFDHVHQRGDGTFVSFGFLVYFQLYQGPSAMWVRLDYSRPIRDFVPDLKACARASAWIERISALGIQIVEPKKP